MMNDEFINHAEQDERDGQSGRDKSRPYTIAALLRAFFALLNRLSSPKWTRPGRKRLRARRFGGGRKAAMPDGATIDEAEVNRLLQRHRDLKDVDALAAVGATFRGGENDFWAEPRRIERVLRRLLEQSPPWLRVGQTLAGGDPEDGGGQETVWREQEVREIQTLTLYVPDETWRDKPLASLTMRPARHLGEVWQARLLDQILPPELMLDRCNRGELMIPVRHKPRQRLEFQPETRPVEIVARRSVAVPIENEGGGANGGQLLYLLLDYSASMQGRNAVYALAALSAAVRANMGRRNARYLFRRFADSDQIWPSHVEPPLQARTVAEKDALLQSIFATNFNGGATHVNDALDLAASDIENLRREESLEAEILLVTDGRAEILESTRLRLLRAGVKIHTVMVAREPNPGLAGLSASYTTLDADLDFETTTDTNRHEETAALTFTKTV